ncbi:MAG: hypothetical protein LBR41_01945 [Rickettsiales bacterium]|jgi:hypothetical protein|nr:hypothetical protein [Rickettsiales bacterium]
MVYNKKTDAQFLEEIQKHRLATVQIFQPLAGKLPYTKFGENDVNKNELYKFANFGFFRRFLLLIDCAENIYSIRRPSETSVPDTKTRKNLTINLQCFVFNLYGAYENLARIFAIMTNFSTKNIFDISFFAKGQKLTNTLPDNIKVKFINGKANDGYKEYFDEYLKWIRHSLAHQEPFYIPPEFFDAANPDDYLKLEAEWKNTYNSMLEAKNDLAAILDNINEGLAKIEQIEAKRQEKAFFVPLFGNQEQMFNFYQTVLVDLNTLSEIASLILIDLTNRK